MKEKVLVTSALPYANAPLHFGHIAGAYLPGDCYARFERMQGKDVAYICGSDEHGVAITLSADLAGRIPKEHVELFHAINKDLFKKLNFSFDHFSRTSWEGHVAPSQQFFLDLLEAGYIEDKVTDQLYSEEESRFLADRYVVGTCPECGYEHARGDECPKCAASYEAIDLVNPRSKMTGSALTLKPTRHWFLRLDLFKERLLSWLETKNWKPNVVNFVKGYIKGLRPRAITRDCSWGVPVPLKEAEGKVLYVWFEAPIGYISASMEWSEKKGQPDLWKEFWMDQNTKLVHFIGKDNIPFHSVIFPAMVMGQKLPLKLVDELQAYEFLNLEGRQFSKSEGWTIDLESFFEKYSTDQIRYTIAANAPETSDSEFTWKDFQSRCNSDLVGKYGNFVNRTLVFAKKQCGGIVPERGDLSEVDREFQKNVARVIEEVQESYQNFHLRRASQKVMEIAQIGNVYFNEKMPWKDAKSGDEEGVKRMGTTIALCIDCIQALAVASFPIMPETAEKIWRMIGLDQLESSLWGEALAAEISSGLELPQPEILFHKVEDAAIDEEIEKLHELKGKVSAG